MKRKLLHNIGIIKAIMLSGNKVAYMVLIYRILFLIIKPIDIFIWALGSLFKGVSKEPLMIFVVGSHRSGATFISQVVSRLFPFYSIGNFNSLFLKSTYLIHKLFKPDLFKCRGSTYQNYYGQTSGLFEINDAHEVWDQWYGSDHSTIPESLPIHVKKNMFAYFSKLYSSINAPIISKSGRNSLNITQLNNIFDNGFFIVVDRNLEDVVISTLEASNIFKSDEKGWGLKINNPHIHDDENNKIVGAVIQCIKIKNKITEQLREIDSSRYVVVDYKAFCNDTEEQLQLISNALALRYKTTYRVKTCVYSKFKTSSCVDKKLLSEVRKVIHKYSYMIER